MAQPLLGMRTGAVARDLLILSSGVSRVSKEPVLSLSKEAGGRETPTGMSCFVMSPPLDVMNCHVLSCGRAGSPAICHAMS